MDEILDSHALKLKRKYENELLVPKNREIDKIITILVSSTRPLKSEEISSLGVIIKTLIKLNDKIKTKKYIQKISNLKNIFDKKVLNNQIEKDLINDFAKKALDKEIINVIGITTTGKQTISYLNEEKDLFVQYPINFEIIDEVSKSSTIEILNTLLLSEKTMMAGDYRQLPPNLSDFDENLMKEFYNWGLSKFSNKPFFKCEFDSFYLKIVNLFTYPLFKKHAQKLKSTNGNNAYQFLKIQHRFNKEIMDLVNFVYEDEEKLEMPKQDRIENIIKINYDKTYSYPINILDTSMVSEQFMSFLREKSKKDISFIKVGDESFDQSISLIDNTNHNARFNEYNAFAIYELVRKFKDEEKIEPDKIGIIAITKSQKLIIRKFLNNYLNDKEYVSKIKIDTVDNFQGRENDIIIVDLVRGKNIINKEGKFEYPKSRVLDFYEKIERLNVAVSRARNKLIIVGAVEKYFSDEVTPKIDDVHGNFRDIRIFKE